MESDSVIVVFFRNDRRSSNGPRMLLKQLGSDHVRVLLGNYECRMNSGADMQGNPAMKGIEAESRIWILLPSGRKPAGILMKVMSGTRSTFRLLRKRKSPVLKVDGNRIPTE